MLFFSPKVRPPMKHQLIRTMRRQGSALNFPVQSDAPPRSLDEVMR